MVNVSNGGSGYTANRNILFSSRLTRCLDISNSAVFSVKTEKNANLSYYCFAVFNGLTFARMHGIAATKRNKIPKNFAVI